MKKRTQNTIGLKFKYVAQTNTKPSRYRVTQTNINKGKYISTDFYNKTPLEAISDMLEVIPDIKSFSLVVDNTQNDYFLFSIDVHGSTFPNLLTYF